MTYFEGAFQPNFKKSPGNTSSWIVLLDHIVKHSAHNYICSSLRACYSIFSALWMVKVPIEGCLIVLTKKVGWQPLSNVNHTGCDQSNEETTKTFNQMIDKDNERTLSSQFFI